jgi:hypothetical protein
MWWKSTSVSEEAATSISGKKLEELVLQKLVNISYQTTRQDVKNASNSKFSAAR